VQGEAGAMEEQTQGAPIGPEQRGRPANPPTLTIPQMPVENAPVNAGTIAEVVPQRSAVAHAAMARPSTPEESVGVALLGLPGLSTTGRRLAMHLAGFPQADMFTETPGREAFVPPVMVNPDEWAGGIPVPEGEEEEVVPEEQVPTQPEGGEV